MGYLEWVVEISPLQSERFSCFIRFFIYVSHALICYKMLKLFVVKLNPTPDLALLGVYALTVLLTLALLLSTFYLLKRYAPGFLKILTGRKRAACRYRVIDFRILPSVPTQSYLVQTLW